jgi:protein O-GlcNAc transferase
VSLSHRPPLAPQTPDGRDDRTQTVIAEARRLAAAGQFAAARDVVTAAGTVTDAGALELLARLWLHDGDAARAHAAALAAARLAPSRVDVLYTLGLCCKACGDLDAAIRHYRDVLGREPGFANAHVSLGVALRAAGRPLDAAAAYRRALALDPHNGVAQQNLAALSGDRNAASTGDPLSADDWTRVDQQIQRAGAEVANGRIPEALVTLHALPPALLALALVQREVARLLERIGQLERALQSYERVAAAEPDDAEAFALAGRTAAALGLVARADANLRRAVRLRPDAALELKRRLLLPAISDSAADIVATRARYATALAELSAAPPRLDLPDSAAWVPTFYLAYHGENDRPLQQQLASLYARACPSLRFTAPHCRRWRRPRRLRIGFLSAFFGQHSIGRTSVGLVRHLPRERFEVCVIGPPWPARDGLAARIRQAADRAIDIPASVAAARERIAALELDVLFFQDIGMDATSYFLSFARLAPVQCVSFGHPDTTGVPAMDYFVSNDRYEPPGAADHYSEDLIQLSGLPTLAYYERPPPPPRSHSRASFGLAGNEHVYLCPQTLFKLHPSFDALVAGILRRDPRGRVVLIDTLCKSWVDQLRCRFATVAPDVAGRILFLPRLDGPAYLDLLALADVVLDTTHFNGMNSSLETFSVGTPVVTLPTGLQRGRHTTAMYQAMGLPDWVASNAEQYVLRAVQLGTDSGEAHDARRELGARAAALFEDRRVVEEFARFFDFAADRVGNGHGRR